MSALDLTRIPEHVALVMDGNGRWAQRRGRAYRGSRSGRGGTDGHRVGALAAGVRWITVYAFSTENWSRPLDEVRYLMGFNERLLMTRRDELHEKNVKVQFLGRRDWRVPGGCSAGWTSPPSSPPPTPR
ncbi:MAG: undecaprenyl diphosphate synthase family protein [Microthrixaceae bacterium]